MSSIRKLLWGKPSSELFAQGSSGAWDYVAIWPAPVNADECFAEAGFDCFEDAEESWDREWFEVIVRLVETLAQLGAPNLLNHDDVFQARSRRGWEWIMPWKSLVDPVQLSVVERLELSTREDQLPAAIAKFGDPVRATLVTGSGHEILWLAFSLNDINVEHLLKSIAGKRDVDVMQLNWHRLLGPEERACL